jgi:hypothetical protein
MKSAVGSWTVQQAVIVQAILLAVQGILYFGSSYARKSYCNVMRKIDGHIPFYPPSVFVYILWFPLIAAFPLMLFQFSRAVYLCYLLSILTGVAVSVTVYLIFPTGFERPVPPDTLSGRVLKAVQKSDSRGVNCLPSLHCIQCFTVIWFACACTEMPLLLRAGSVLLSLCITASTVLTKQHTLIDVIAAVPAAACSILSGYLLANC